jgi:hypothetical protein
MNDTNDPLDRDLDRARESVNSLAQGVDTAGGWNVVSAAVERAPHVRALHRLQLAAVMVIVVAIVGAAVYTRHSDPKTSTAITQPAHKNTASADCTLPRLPTPGTAHSDLDLAGPAVSSLRGGAAQTRFELGGGELTVSPPRPGDTPSVSAQQAECAALASSNSNGWSLLDSASSYGGAAVGYARVTVSPQLVAAADDPLYMGGQMNQNTHPKLPKATAYQDRLAWVVVVRDVQISHGPMRPDGPPGGASPSSPGNHYDAFLVDAETGTDALIYTESQTAGTGGSVTVPAERVSVPWTLVSRSPNGYSGEISATVLPCDGVPNPVNVDTYRRAAAVVVERPVGAACGAPIQVTIPLHAANVTWNLPPEIAPDPLGPVVTLPERASSGTNFISKCSPKPVRQCKYDSPDATGGVLRQIGAEENGTTIEVKRGSVFVVGPIQLGNRFAALPATSSDATVLGMFPDSKIHEFRAWRVGHADLFVPTTTCDPSTGKGVPCTPPWIVHINITD